MKNYRKGHSNIEFMKKLDKNTDCAVVYVLGQSNAHAHCQAMKEEDIISDPLKNVHTLCTEHNQSFDVKDLVWSNFTSYGYNLGETQDCTYSFASYLAKNWQKRIDDGEKLPDLYIVQMSIGGQMIIGGMWDPNYPKPRVLTSGTYVVCEIALYNLAMHILPLVHEDLSKRFKHPQSIGIHWIGSEGDTSPGAYDRPDFHDIYYNFFKNIVDATGFESPLYLYKIVREKKFTSNGESVEGIKAVNNEFKVLTELIDNCEIVDPKQADFYDPSMLTDNIFSDDLSHYDKRTQEWFAKNFMKQILQ